MSSMYSSDHDEEQWYPKLPEGYTEEARMMNGSGMDGWMPGAGMPSYGTDSFMPGMGSPGYGMQDWGGGTYGTPFGQSNIFPGFPGFPPSQGGHGFPPGHGGPGFPGSGGFPGGGGFPPGQGFPPGHGTPGFPPSPGMPGFPGGQSGQGNQAPTAPPPNQIPAYPNQQMLRVDPGGIRGCLFRYTYVWTSRRNGFWFFPTFVGRTSVAGFRWRSSRRRWEYFGIDLNRIDQFTCF
ncbi:hypothetical protein [Sporosarcina luteola]|uniref:hypothetical protein n=1 Tax=Sporosarcina luteola TaxID=582850 RepID=UPI001FE42874|nr:hypothetical protein [Sporosarcina luteola]